MKIINKIVYSVMIIMMIINCLNVFTYSVSAKDYSEMITDAQGFISKGEEEAEGIEVGNVTEQFKPIGQLLTMIGGGVMVAVTTFMGIKYLTAGPEAQAKLKQQLVGVIVSGVVIFGAYGIWQTVGKIVMQFDK